MLDARIGLATSGKPWDPQSYSGTPASLDAALREVAREVVSFTAQLPDPVDRPAVAALALASQGPRKAARAPRQAVAAGRQRARNGPEIEALRRARLHALVRRARADAWVQHGAEFRLPATARTVTYEDTTLLQARRSWPWPHLSGWSEREYRRQEAVGRWNYDRATAVCMMSHWAASSAVEDYGQPATKVRVVGVGKNHEPSAPAERDWRTPRFLFVGYDFGRKNGPRVLRAFARIRDQHPDATLDVVGGHPRLDAPGVHGHGVLSPREPEHARRLEALYGRATCFVLPSLHEPAGIVYAEAGAAGVASIGTTNGGAPTLVGDAGRVVEPGDERSITQAMLALADPDTAARLGAAARERSALFTWRKVAERLVRALGLPGAGPDLADFL